MVTLLFLNNALNYVFKEWNKNLLALFDMVAIHEKILVDPELFKPLREGYKDHVVTFVDDLIWTTYALKLARQIK